jgi:hypothetical protein
MLNVLVCIFCFWKLPFAYVLKINVLNEGYTKRWGWSKDVSVHAMKALGDVEVQSHSFILNFRQWIAATGQLHALTTLPPGKDTLVPFE